MRMNWPGRFNIPVSCGGRTLPGGSTLERIAQIELEISRTQKNKARIGLKGAMRDA